MTNKITRRDFLKESGAGVAAIGVLSQKLAAKSADLANAPAVDRKRLIEALAETLIPTAEGYPGYQHLEQYGITEEVLKGLQMLSQQDLNLFNAAAGEVYSGKSFLDLDPEQRTEYLHFIVASFPAGAYNDPGPAKSSAAELSAQVDRNAVETLQKVFRFTRNRVLVTFYRNFPEDRVARDKNGLPLLPPGDLHQIIDPNTKQLVTGWDVANFPGPLSWEEEEARRAKWMKIRWEND
jgi:hypothetical protein